MSESRSSEGVSPSIDLVKFYENKMQMTNSSKKQNETINNLGLMERSVLRVLNFEVNHKLRTGMQETYDRVAITPVQDDESSYPGEK